MPETLLQVENLKKVYESSTGVVEAIGDISFSMDRENWSASSVLRDAAKRHCSNASPGSSSPPREP